MDGGSRDRKAVPHRRALLVRVEFPPANATLRIEKQSPTAEVRISANNSRFKPEFLVKRDRHVDSPIFSGTEKGNKRSGMAITYDADVCFIDRAPVGPTHSNGDLAELAPYTGPERSSRSHVGSFPATIYRVNQMDDVGVVLGPTFTGVGQPPTVPP